MATAEDGQDRAWPEIMSRSDTLALDRLVGFGRHLRSTGLAVGTGRILAFCRAAAVLGPFDREDLHRAARATLVSRPEDFPTLDAAFARYFGNDAGAREEDAEAHLRLPGAGRPDQAGESASAIPAASRWSSAEAEEEVDGEAALRLIASEAEVVRRKDFAELSDEERHAALAMIRRLALLMPSRSSRRYRVAAEGPRFDLRRTLRKSLRTEGEPFHRAWKRRQSRRRALVLVLDVSGSMAPYSRPLLEFGHAAAMSGRKVEVFCFGTRLTRITRALRSRSPDEAMTTVAESVTDWEGGTRIGESLKALLDEWGSRAALRGSVVILCSDGLERGDPDMLSAQMRRLSRLAYRLVWLNPLKGSPRYEPLARGMAASLPHVDVFLPGHNLESLEGLAGALAGL